ncbi:hypothetical protein [Acetobacter sp. LMG 32666]|uniref:hypothetical protein n=1 Tax=Acetobacter sp. LMG 32666 TaxID=2959295 RepID=UPI0030C7F0E8
MSRVPLWSEYKEWPRERVIFNKKHNNFVVYADKNILTETGKQELTSTFSLHGNPNIFKQDGHYVSARQITI